MRARLRIALLAVLGIGLISAPASQAQGKVTVPTKPGQKVTVSWEGTVLPGANAENECGQATDVGQDVHEVDLAVPRGTYKKVAIVAVATIVYEGANDFIVTVIMPDETAVSGDDGFVDTDESVAFANPQAGLYQIIACMFVGASPQDYTGTLTLTATKPVPAPPPPCARPAAPMRFAAPSYVDTGRAGGEPSIEVHPDGTLLYGAHAGTTHFYAPLVTEPNSAAFIQNYQGQVYYWVSDDRGKTWQFVERSTPPSGVPNSGFSDPDFAIDEAGNVYVSEINLVNVAVSKSTDSGHSYELRNVLGMTLTDRQWTAAGPEDVLFIVGNPSGGGTFPSDPVGHTGHTIYRSTNGGVDFSPGVTDDGGLGDIKYDLRKDTLYEAHYAEGMLQIAAFRDPLNEDAEVALTPQLHTIATGVSMLSHWPSIDVDSRGNVYIVWDEDGNGVRGAGVWYSHSKTGGRTWAKPVRVDRDDRTDIWPWLAVGRPGRVAISWFGNQAELPDHNAELAGEEDGWDVYAAQTLTGLGCRGSTSAGFGKPIKVTPEPFHIGTVCMAGTICQAQLVDRRLGDYFTIDIDTSGRVVGAYSDTRQGGSVALPAYFRQTGGPAF